MLKVSYRGIQENQPCSMSAMFLTDQSRGAKIMNQFNQEPHLTQDTNGKVTNSQLDTTNESQEEKPFPIR